MFKVIVHYRVSEGLKDYKKILKQIPIKHRSNGSIVWMKGEDPWLDYNNVTFDEIIELIIYLKKKNEKYIDLKIGFKE